METQDRVLRFEGDSGVDFMEQLARTLAKSLVFEGQGPMSDDEQAAFIWGFRHGIHQTFGLLMQAKDSESDTAVLNRIIAEALKAWDIGTTARLAFVGPASEAPAPGVH